MTPSIFIALLCVACSLVRTVIAEPNDFVVIQLSRNVSKTYNEVHRRTLFNKATARMLLHRPEVESYLSATIQIGTPPRKFELIVDTGSSITFVPCSQCSHCGKHQHSAFHIDKSSTAMVNKCTTPMDCKCESIPCSCANKS